MFEVIFRQSKHTLYSRSNVTNFSTITTGESRTLAGFRRCYNATADEPISSGGFYHRLTPLLAEYLRDLVEAALDEVAVSDAVGADIDRFRDVMIADGTVLRLHELLADEFQARHEEQAGAIVIVIIFE